MTKDINKELEKLERYRNLFKLIISQPDQTLEYSTDELRYYYYTIEDIEEKKNFKPFLIYTDPDPKDICKNINFDAYEQYKAGVSAEPCIIKPLPDGTPDLSDSIDSGPCIIQKDKDGNPFIKTDLTNKENK